MIDLSVYAKDAAVAVEMRHALENYGINVNRAGYALCPFHDEKTGSLKVYPHSFYCYGCGKGGDVITLVRSLFDLPFTDALRKVNEDFALGLPLDEKPTIKQRREMQNRRLELERARKRKQKQHDAVYAHYLDLLVTRDYLQDCIDRLKPAQWEETLHPVFADALHRLPYIDYLIDSFDFENEVDSWT